MKYRKGYEGEGSPVQVLEESLKIGSVSQTNLIFLSFFFFFNINIKTIS